MSEMRKRARRHPVIRAIELDGKSIAAIVMALVSLITGLKASRESGEVRSTATASEQRLGARLDSLVRALHALQSSHHRLEIHDRKLDRALHVSPAIELGPIGPPEPPEHHEGSLHKLWGLFTSPFHHKETE